MALIPKCEKCGKLDTRQQYASTDEAAKQGAFQSWTCPNCAWTEFDLVDAEAEAEPAKA